MAQLSRQGKRLSLGEFPGLGQGDQRLTGQAPQRRCEQSGDHRWPLAAVVAHSQAGGDIPPAIIHPAGAEVPVGTLDETPREFSHASDARRACRRQHGPCDIGNRRIDGDRRVVPAHLRGHKGHRQRFSIIAKPTFQQRQFPGAVGSFEGAIVLFFQLLLIVPIQLQAPDRSDIRPFLRQFHPPDELLSHALAHHVRPEGAGVDVEGVVAAGDAARPVGLHVGDVVHDAVFVHGAEDVGGVLAGHGQFHVLGPHRRSPGGRGVRGETARRPQQNRRDRRESHHVPRPSLPPDYRRNRPPKSSRRGRPHATKIPPPPWPQRARSR